MECQQATHMEVYITLQLYPCSDIDQQRSTHAGPKGSSGEQHTNAHLTPVLSNEEGTLSANEWRQAHLSPVLSSEKETPSAN